MELKEKRSQGEDVPSQTRPSFGCQSLQDLHIGSRLVGPTTPLASPRLFDRRDWVGRKYFSP
jgi:hypothetical protein